MAAIPARTIIIKNTSQSEGTDKAGTEWFRWTVSIETNHEDFIDEIKSVKYHLHPSFPTADIEIKDKQSGFKLISKGWGEFTIQAEIIRSDGKKTMLIIICPWLRHQNKR